MTFRKLSLAIVLALASLCGAAAQPWRGKINGFDAYIPDFSKPLRAALINNAPAWLANDEPGWRAVATQFNIIELDVPLSYFHPDESAQKILDTLKAGSRMFASHPEIANLDVAMFGFSASSAGAAITASSKLLSNPDPGLPPQRVLAVMNLDQLNQHPYEAPAWVPQLFLSDPGDRFGGLLTPVEESDPPIPHDVFARRRATELGAPLTVITQPGHWHGGSVYGYHGRVDFRFLGVWLAEVLKLRLPPAPPLSDPALAPDWRNHAGWLGTYDVATKTGAEPWGDGERMVNVAIAPRESYHDPRPFIWLPSAYAAEIWRKYAASGDMPPLAPDHPMSPLRAFIRFGSNPPSKGDDIAAEIASGSADVPLAASCGVDPGPATGAEARLIVSFDRALVSGDAKIEGGGATIDGAPSFWSNVMVVRLTGLTHQGALKISLSGLTPKDGGPATAATVTALCK